MLMLYILWDLTLKAPCEMRAILFYTSINKTYPWHVIEPDRNGHLAFRGLIYNHITMSRLSKFSNKELNFKNCNHFSVVSDSNKKKTKNDSLQLQKSTFKNHKNPRTSACLVTQQYTL